MSVVLDVAAHPIDRSGEKRAENESEQHPVLDADIGGQREEIKADVLVVERIICAVWQLIEKLQEDTPVAGFYGGDQQSEQTCTERDKPGPKQSLAHDRERSGQRRVAGRVPRRGGECLCRLPPGKTHREQSVQPKYGAGRHQNGEKQYGFGANAGQENLQIADRGKTQPIDQEVAREPEQDQANPADGGRDDDPDHGALPWCLPPGSGVPDRHDPPRISMPTYARSPARRPPWPARSAEARDSARSTR